jgi:hypothetical protein
MRWTCRLLLRRMPSWPHRDGAGPEIVEGGPRRGAPVVVVRAVEAVVLAFPLAIALALTLTLAFAVIVGIGGRTGRGLLRT